MAKKPSKAVKEAAAWMVEQIKERRSLDQSDAADYLERAYSGELTYENENGNTAISKDVLAAFKKLTGDEVIWDRGYKEWRLRTKFDRPGRQQD